MLAERVIERVIYTSRWILAPIYLGLVASLLVLMIKFVQELTHLGLHVFEAKETDIILGVLSLIDLSLAANLLLMVTFSGYESFVSKLDISADQHRPEWMGKIDFSGLKLRLVASIVAISAIHLLKSFMDVSRVDKTDLMWLVITHMAFVISGILLALMDLFAARAHQRGVDI